MFIPIELYGKRIDKILALLLPQYSRMQLSRWLNQGLITVDGKAVKAKDKFHHSAYIEFLENFSELNTSNINLPEPIPLNIMYEDDYLLIINKPVGLIVHPGAGNSNNTLLNGLLYHLPALNALPRVGIIHRLDKNTSGLLLIAKTLMVYNCLVKQLQSHEIQRYYLALVHNRVISSGVINTNFGRHSINRLKMAVCNHGRKAITHYEINKHYDIATLLNIKLQTGRTHQIRVHMAHINHHIIGDKLYGKLMKNILHLPKDLIEKINIFPRQALHAKQLIFTHPVTHNILEINASIPEDFALLLNMLIEHKI